MFCKNVDLKPKVFAVGEGKFSLRWHVCIIIKNIKDFQHVENLTKIKITISGTKTYQFVIKVWKFRLRNDSVLEVRPTFCRQLVLLMKVFQKPQFIYVKIRIFFEWNIITKFVCRCIMCKWNIFLRIFEKIFVCQIVFFLKAIFFSLSFFLLLGNDKTAKLFKHTFLILTFSDKLIHTNVISSIKITEEKWRPICGGGGKTAFFCNFSRNQGT